MQALFELTIVRSKLVIKQLKEFTLDDLVPVRETINSISFILGNAKKWDYQEMSKGCVAVTKVRLCESEKIIEYLKENRHSVRLDSIDSAFISDITKVYKLKIEGKNELELKSMDKDTIAKQYKEKVLAEILEAIKDLNDLAETMGGIL